MIIIGYDYGTTTSWLSVARNMDSPQIICKKSSLLITDTKLIFGDEAITNQDQGIFIESPKKYIINSQWDEFEKTFGVSLDNTLIQFTRSLLENAPSPNPNEDVHVTITIPNCYDAPRMRFMRNVMNRAFSQYDKYIKSQIIIHLLPEPVAAALHYAININIPGGVCESRYIVTADIGGGTTDFAVISLKREYTNNKFNLLFKVLATESDGNLGGNHIDNLLYNKFIKSYTPQTGEELQIKHLLTIAKETLSYNNNPISIKDNEYCIINQELIESILSAEVLRDNNTFYQKIVNISTNLKRIVSNQYRADYRQDFQWSNVLLLPIGGSMKIPYLRKSLSILFENAEICELKTYEGIMYGALHYSGISSNVYDMFDIVKVEERTRHPISVEYLDHRLHPIINENEPDGEYEIDTIRPLSVDNDQFDISIINLFYREGGTINEHDTPDYQLPINKSFPANSRKANMIPIKIKLTVENSMLSKAVVTIDKNVFVYDFKC